MRSNAETISGACFACLNRGCQASTDRHAHNERCLQAGCQEATEPAHVEDLEAAREAYEAFHHTDMHYAFCGLKRTDRFTPSTFFGGNNDGKVRASDGRVVADTGGHEAMTELIAVALNTYMDTHYRVALPENNSARGQYAEPEMILPGKPNPFAAFTGDLSIHEPTPEPRLK